MMKKFLVLLFTALVAITLAACGGSEGKNGSSENENSNGSNDGDVKELVVGATSVPYDPF